MQPFQSVRSGSLSTSAMRVRVNAPSRFDSQPRRAWEPLRLCANFLPGAPAAPDTSDAHDELSPSSAPSRTTQHYTRDGKRTRTWTRGGGRRGRSWPQERQRRSLEALVGRADDERQLYAVLQGTTIAPGLVYEVCGRGSAGCGKGGRRPSQRRRSRGWLISPRGVAECIQLG